MSAKWARENKLKQNIVYENIEMILFHLFLDYFI